jgi:hypothetical protein
MTSHSFCAAQPFALDYHETVLSLLDVMSEAYSRISKILGPSSIPHSTSLGPLSGVTPYPGISYLFASEANNYSSQYPATNLTNSSSHLLLHHNLTSSPNPNQPPVQFPSVTNSSTTLPVSSEPENSLWSIANASSVGMGMGASFSQPTVNWSSSQSDMIVKIDSKLKVHIFPF